VKIFREMWVLYIYVTICMFCAVRCVIVICLFLLLSNYSNCIFNIIFMFRFLVLYYCFFLCILCFVLFCVLFTFCISFLFLYNSTDRCHRVENWSKYHHRRRRRRQAGEQIPFH